MEHFYKNLGENWFNYHELYSEIVSAAVDDSHFVEVGSWKGMSSAYMAVEIINSGKKIKFDCVDIWEYMDIQQDIPQGKYENLYETFLKNISPVKDIISPIKSISWEAASLYEDESLDFIFIDAAHDYESVKKDLSAWYPKLKSTGTIAGHDYLTSKNGVKRAVDEFFEKVEQNGPCWVYKKNYSHDS